MSLRGVLGQWEYKRLVWLQESARSCEVIVFENTGGHFQPFLRGKSNAHLPRRLEKTLPSALRQCRDEQDTSVTAQLAYQPLAPRRGQS